MGLINSIKRQFPRSSRACRGLLAGWLIATRAAILSAAAPEASNANLHDITITVVAAQTARPIPTAKVAVPAPPSGPPSSTLVQTDISGSVTDERGVAVVRLSRRNRDFTIRVEHTNYASRELRWYAGSSSTTLPTTHTFKLEPGITVGGFVRNEKDEPVPGATVISWGNSFVPSPPGESQPRFQQEYSTLNRGSAIITDQKGFWARTSVPSDLERINLEVIRPGGARTRFITEAGKMPYGEPTSDVRLADLRTTNAVLKLEEGMTIGGVVVDGTGRAIPNVRLKERRGRNYQFPIYEFTNNVDGTFELPHRAPAQYLLAAEVDGFATKSVIIKPGAEGDVRIVLSEAKPLRLRVLDENDQPLPSRVQALEWRSENQLLNWNGQTDRDGRVVWTNAPTDPVALSIAASNYVGRNVRITADSTEKLIRLRKDRNPGVAVRVKALDAKTGKPLDWFQVRRNAQYGEGFVTWGEPPNRSGEFQTNILATELQRGPGNLRVQVWADGYAPWTSRMAYFDEGDQEFVATLTNAPPPAGILLQPNGSPASDAKLLLNTSSDTLFMNNPAGDFLERPGTYWVRSGTNGSFTLPPAEEHNRILVKHSSGFASLTVGELLRTNEFRLQPWARVEGVLRAGGKPLPKERISLKSPINWMNTEGYSLNILATTDSNGAFTYTNLPPGEYLLYRLPILISGMTHTESHPWPFDLAAGETKKIDYTFGGRSVVGSIETGAEVDWLNDPHMLTLKGPKAPPEPSFYDFVDTKDFEKERKAYGKSPAVKEYDRKRRQFQLLFDRDGNFKADDVPAGTYELRVRVTRPPKDPNMRFSRSQEELGLLVKEVTIPPGGAGEEFDLGNFVMEITGEKIATQPIADFRATTLDGKSFALESLRGKPAVLLFWAGWAPKSVARLADLRALQESTNAAVSFVTINLDDDAASARAGLRDFKRGVHTRLEGRARADVTEQSGIDTLPTMVVLDEQLRVIARDVEGKRLRSALDRVLARMAKK